MGSHGVSIVRMIPAFLLLLAPSAKAQPFDSGISLEGAITRWLVLGPFGTENMGCTPSVDQMRLDFLTDGQDILGDLWRPSIGDTVHSDCKGAAACAAWDCQQARFADPAVNCADPVPLVTLLDSDRADGGINLNAFWGGGDRGDPPGNVMAYAWAYLRIKSDRPREVFIGHN